MQFLAVIRRRVEAFPAEAFEPWFAGEQEQARTLYAEGFIRQIWRRGDKPGAVLLLEAADEQTARERLASLPMLAAEMLELTELVPLLPYGGFGPSEQR